MRKRKSISKEVRNEVYEMYDGHCTYCGCEIAYNEMQVDHVHPFYLEGFREQLGLIKGRLEKEFIYRLAKKYGLIEEKEVKIKFHFEERK